MQKSFIVLKYFCTGLSVIEYMNILLVSDLNIIFWFDVAFSILKINTFFFFTEYGDDELIENGAKGKLNIFEPLKHLINFQTTFIS